MKRELERYLKRATRGLYGASLKDVWNELEQDILERVRVSQAFGLSESQALSRALEQLGDPRAVSAGMANTYVWPRAVKVSLSLALVGALGISALAQPGVSTSTRFLFIQVSKKEVLAALEAAGAQVKTDENNIWVKLKSGQQLRYRITDTNQQGNISLGMALELDSLLNAALKANIPVKVSGWQKLRVELGSTAITLEPPQGETDFSSWYKSTARGLMPIIQTGSATAVKNDWVTLRGKRPELAGQVVFATVYRPLTPPQYETVKQFDNDTKSFQNFKTLKLEAITSVSQVGQDGQFEFKVPAAAVKSGSANDFPYMLGLTKPEDFVGLYLNRFAGSSQNNSKFSYKKNLVLETQLKEGQVLEPGKTYTL